jgi:hypothetical protein
MVKSGVDMGLFGWKGDDSALKLSTFSLSSLDGSVRYALVAIHTNMLRRLAHRILAGKVSNTATFAFTASSSL